MSRTANYFIRVALWVGALLFALSFVHITWDARLIVPFSDEWDFLAFYQDTFDHGLTFAGLWAPNNGHRLLIPRLLFLARDTLFGGDPLVLILGSLLLYVGLIGIIVVVVLREPRLKGTILQTGIVASTITLLTWSVQLENFQWSIQITYILPTFLVVAAIALVAMEPPVGGEKYWPTVAATLIALLACLSFGVGLGAWPALLVLTVARRRSMLAITIIGVGAALSASWFLEYANTFTSVATPRSATDILLYLCRYVSPPFIRESYALSIGAALLCAGGLAVGFALLRGLPGRLAGLGVGLVTFGLSVAVLAALARPNGEFPYSRYATFSLLYWVGLLLLVGLAANLCARPVRWAIGAAVFAGVLRFPLATQVEASQPFIDRADRTTQAALSMVVGTPDDEAIATELYPRSQLPLRLMPFLMRREYGFFGHPLVKAIGTQATERFRIGADGCPASVDVEARPSGWHFSGGFEGAAGPEWLVLVDGAGQVRGLAARARHSNRFAGYASMASMPGTLYGVHGDTLCFAATIRDDGRQRRLDHARESRRHRTDVTTPAPHSP